MRKFIPLLIWMVLAAIPTINAQQASPNQTTATQQTSKKAGPNRAFPQPKVQPTHPTTAHNNPGQKKGVANNHGYEKPAGNNPRHVKTTGDDPGEGKVSH